MSAAIGAAAGGVRVMTATSANGLALMWEMLYIASGCRLPIAMTVVNRALSSPINIHGDHSDSMGARDAGWIQLYSENAQEAYDNLIQAFRIGESEGVLLPVMVCMDGFITSHTAQVLEVIDDHEVTDFLGEYVPDRPLLDVENPITVGPLALQDYYFEFKRQQVDAMEKAMPAILDVAAEFEEMTGRKYSYFEEYRLDDAEIAIVTLNSSAGTAKEAVDMMRDEGISAGLLKPRVFRPFPEKEVVEALKGLKVVAVMDRAHSYGAAGGPVFTEIKSAFYDEPNKPLMTNYIYGLGGRNLSLEDVQSVYKDLVEIADANKVKQTLNFLGVR
jgi:pyruvate ferredoxin oxidoreductase alpha subunit